MFPRDILKPKHRLSIDLAIRAPLVLHNAGTGPADDIHVTVDVPARFELMVTEEKAPQDVTMVTPTGLIGTVSLDDAWDLETESRAIIRIDRLKQKMEAVLPPLFLRLRAPDDRRGFELDVGVNAADPPVTTSLRLPVTLTGN